MRKKLISFLSCLAVVALSQLALAQDGAPADYDFVDPERERYERERLIASPGEGEHRYFPSTTQPGNTTNPQSPAPRDSSSTAESVSPETPASQRVGAVVKPIDKQVPTRGEDDSILSFNFLYYIIQKYKLQDIVD